MAACSYFSDSIFFNRLCLTKNQPFKKNLEFCLTLIRWKGCDASKLTQTSQCFLKYQLTPHSGPYQSLQAYQCSHFN